MNSALKKGETMLTFLWDEHLTIRSEAEEQDGKTIVRIWYIDKFNLTAGPFKTTIPSTQGSFRIEAFHGGKSGVIIQVVEILPEGSDKTPLEYSTVRDWSTFGVCDQ